MGIEYHSGDIFTAATQVIVNPVNCKGHMGKGLALAFKQRYPAMFSTYVGIHHKLVFITNLFAALDKLLCSNVYSYQVCIANQYVLKNILMEMFFSKGGCVP